MTTTHMLNNDGADIVYDAHGPLPTADGLPPLFMIGQPMTASGFGTLASHFSDRTVVTYDPRGLGRSSRSDGRIDHSPTVQAKDVHGVIAALGVGPVEMFASSGGAVTALALVAAYPEDVVTLVAHEPPLIPVLPEFRRGRARSRGGSRRLRRERVECRHGCLYGDDDVAGRVLRPVLRAASADPAMFGMPAEDDGSRDSPLLSDRSWAVSSYRPDVQALTAAPTRS